jgi:hypothetical protein
MTSKNWKKIIALDNERRIIEQRIHIFTAIHHGSSSVMRCEGFRSPLTDEDRKSVENRSIAQDAVAYIHIQDEQWALAKMDYRADLDSQTTRGQSIPG